MGATTQHGTHVVDLDRRRVTLLPPAELDVAAEPWLAAALAHAEAQPGTDVVVALRDVRFVGVHATAMLAAAAGRVRGSGRCFEVQAPPPALRLAAQVCGLSDQLGLASGGGSAVDR